MTMTRQQIDAAYRQRKREREAQNRALTPMFRSHSDGAMLTEAMTLEQYRRIEGQLTHPLTIIPGRRSPGALLDALATATHETTRISYREERSK